TTGWSSRSSFSSKFDPMTMAFLKILVKKGREALLRDIAKEAISEFRKIKHITTVRLTTAVKLSDSVVEAIRKKLDASDTTDKNVEITTRVNPELIGGFVLEYDDKLYDASVTHQLEQAKKGFKDNLYISQIIAG
ncbi:MAG: ATP synthase F1 subunit delta, partial [Bacteroidota bacterium]